MKRSLLLTALSLAPVVAPPATAQGLLESAPAQVVKLYSRQVGDSFKIRVLLPPMTPGEATRFPVVYMTDTHSGFAVEDDMLRLMMLGDTPRFIAVGSGIPGRRASSRRWRFEPVT
jgi:predicted alpha/beta superfamily hydrolase